MTEKPYFIYSCCRHSLTMGSGVYFWLLSNCYTWWPLFGFLGDTSAVDRSSLSNINMSNINHNLEDRNCPLSLLHKFFSSARGNPYSLRLRDTVGTVEDLPPCPPSISTTASSKQSTPPFSGQRPPKQPLQLYNRTTP